MTYRHYSRVYDQIVVSPGDDRPGITGTLVSGYSTVLRFACDLHWRAADPGPGERRGVRWALHTKHMVNFKDFFQFKKSSRSISKISSK
jgi:hypothetical protein